MVTRLEQAHILLTFYQKSYSEKYGHAPVFNRNKTKFLISDALRDIKPSEFKQLIVYYLETEKEPSIMALCYEYADILEAKKQNERDSSARKQLLIDTQNRVKEFRERFGK